MPCGNEVSVKCRECQRSSSNNFSQGSPGSCNSLIDDGAACCFVAASDAVDQVSLLGRHNSSKPKSRSYDGNRFSCNFHQQHQRHHHHHQHQQRHRHALLLFAALCLLMPLACFGMPSNLNESETLPIQTTAAVSVLNLANNNNQEVSNEISTNLEETPAIEEDIAKFIPSTLGESLEDTIRNAVKNEIELDANSGSPALKKAIEVLPETDKIEIVEYVPVTQSTLANNANASVVATKVVEENVDVIQAATETSCGVGAFVCKFVIKKVDEPVTAAEPVAASLDSANEAATTLEIVKQEEPTAQPLLSEPKEEEFEQVEDNMREARNFERTEPQIEALKPAIAAENDIAVSEHKIVKDVLKAAIKIDNDENAFKAAEIEAEEPKILSYQAYEASTMPKELLLQQEAVEVTALPEALENKNVKVEAANSIETQETATEIVESNESKIESDIAKPQVEINEEFSLENSHESVKDLSELISEPLKEELEQQSNEETVAAESVPTTTPNLVEENLENVSAKKIYETHLISTEIFNNSLTNPTTVKVDSDDIQPVVADHSDVFAQQKSNDLKPEEQLVEASDEKDNETLSIVLEESLTATEPNLPLSEDALKIEELLENEAEVELTTLQPEVPIHNVIKKQGVEPIIEEELEEISSTTAVYKSENIDTTNAPIENVEILSTTPQPQPSTIPSQDTNHITEMSVVFAGKNDEDAVTTAKGSRSINAIHNAAQQHKVSINFDVYPAGQTFNENLAEEMPNGIGKALPTHSLSDDNSTPSTIIITASSCMALLFIVVSVGIFIISHQRQHGTLDIEMQEQRCGKENQDDEPETCIKLLDVELPPPNTSLAFQTDAEAEIECL